MQEWTQATYKKLPQYLVKEINGLDQERFCAEVWLNEQKLGVPIEMALSALIIADRATKGKIWETLQYTGSHRG
ncbi:hypothetical protein MiTs_00870 [Microcystis aeruginosa NIES-2521]|uniref:Uncharacterized protein n=1 Tax=Microcystis aeruginosa NIES-2521 TaxID=2303983 RepID=A0A5A5RQP5_MICAE|nr:hypothetical protein MiTs_00870 [Microcystis aeruginosa NIES-2521]